jgi:hypothetical protein
MPINKSEVSKTIDLKIPSGIPAEVADEIKQQVGDYLVAAILDEVGGGASPVSGKDFPQLSKDYADDQKGGRRLANLDLEGDMLNALTFEPTTKGVKVGIFDSDQAIKAFNHNTGDTLPKRSFIPSPKESFTKSIESEVAGIVAKALKEYKADAFQPDEPIRRTPDETTVRRATTTFTFDDFISGLFRGN